MPNLGFGGGRRPPNMRRLSQMMAAQGRGGDSMLAHINPNEARKLKRWGGSGTINPRTGLPEFQDGTWPRDTSGDSVLDDFFEGVGNFFSGDDNGDTGDNGDNGDNGNGNGNGNGGSSTAHIQDDGTIITEVTNANGDTTWISSDGTNLSGVTSLGGAESRLNTRTTSSNSGNNNNNNNSGNNSGNNPTGATNESVDLGFKQKVFGAAENAFLDPETGELLPFKGYTGSEKPGIPQLEADGTIRKDADGNIVWEVEPEEGFGELDQWDIMAEDPETLTTGYDKGITAGSVMREIDPGTGEPTKDTFTDIEGATGGVEDAYGGDVYYDPVTKSYKKSGYLGDVEVSKDMLGDAYGTAEDLSGITGPKIADPTSVTADKITAPTEVGADQIKDPSKVTADKIKDPTKVTYGGITGPSDVTASTIGAPDKVTADEITAPTGITADEITAPSDIGYDTITADQMSDADFMSKYGTGGVGLLSEGQAVGTDPAVGAQSFTDLAIQNYMDPYIRGVIDPALADVEEQRRQAIIGAGAGALSDRAAWGSRHGVQEGLINEAAMKQAGALSGRLYSEGYAQASEIASRDMDRMLTGDISQAELISMAQKYNMDSDDLRDITNLQTKIQTGEIDASNALSILTSNATNKLTADTATGQFKLDAGTADAANQLRAAIESGQMNLSADEINNANQMLAAIESGQLDLAADTSNAANQLARFTKQAELNLTADEITAANILQAAIEEGRQELTADEINAANELQAAIQSGRLDLDADTANATNELLAAVETGQLNLAADTSNAANALMASIKSGEFDLAADTANASNMLKAAIAEGGYEVDTQKTKLGATQTMGDLAATYGDMSLDEFMTSMSKGEFDVAMGDKTIDRNYDDANWYTMMGLDERDREDDFKKFELSEFYREQDEPYKKLGALGSIMSGAPIKNETKYDYPSGSGKGFPFG